MQISSSGCAKFDFFYNWYLHNLIFPVEGSFQFSIENPDSTSLRGEIGNTCRYQIAICLIVNLDIRYLATDSAAIENCSLVISFGSGLGAPNPRAGNHGPSEWATFFHDLLSSRGGPISSSIDTELPPA